MNRKCKIFAALLATLSIAGCASTGSQHPAQHGPSATTYSTQPAAPPAPFAAIDVNALSWEKVNMHPPLEWFRKRLVNDTTAKGMYVSLLRYPAGVINPNHTHPHPHGFYIIEGQLVTNRGTFGVGNFVWFPAGEVIYHGAGPDHDMVALFISGAPFEINYKGQ